MAELISMTCAVKSKHESLELGFCVRVRLKTPSFPTLPTSAVEENDEIQGKDSLTTVSVRVDIRALMLDPITQKASLSVQLRLVQRLFPAKGIGPVIHKQDRFLTRTD